MKTLSLKTSVEFPYSSIESYLENNLAHKFSGFFTLEELDDIVTAFYGAKDDWIEGFGGEQYALGEVWYHYAEQMIDVEQYIEGAVASREVFEKHIPGLHPRILTFLETLCNAPVKIRDGWAGPGIVSFLAHNFVATKGGSKHFDTEGLTEEELAVDSTVIYSFVAMLQKPKSGGGLRVWDQSYNPLLKSDRDNEPVTTNAGSLVDYQLGDIWMFHGMKVHNIEKFTGDVDRVCLTFHLRKYKNEWICWF